MEQVAYRHNSVELTAHLVRPEGTPKAAILILPTIAGPSALMNERAKWLAELGYVAMVADFYGRGQITDTKEMFRLADDLRVDPKHYRARFIAALESFQEQEGVDSSRIAIIGYCMGGQAALELARDGQEFAAAVSFHGLLDTKSPAQKDTVKARILVCHGHRDPMATPEQVSAFQDEMDEAGADWHMHIYANAVHGFTDPASDERGMEALGYNLSADRQSKAAMLAFFEEVFAQ